MRKQNGVHYGWRMLGIGVWMTALAVFIGSSRSEGTRKDLLGALGCVLLVTGAACVEFSAPKTHP